MVKVEKSLENSRDPVTLSADGILIHGPSCAATTANKDTVLQVQKKLGFCLGDQRPNWYSGNVRSWA